MPIPKSEGGIELQPRDYALLQGLLDSRLMTIKQAASLHFDGKREAAKKRLQKLHHAGLVIQRARRPQDPAIYLLGKHGYMRLRQEGLLDPAADLGWIKIRKRQRVGDLMLRHELAVADAKASFVSAIAKHPSLELIEISISPDRHAFRVIESSIESNGSVRFRSLMAKPDGFIRIRGHANDQSAHEHFFFVEVDMGTESLNRLLQKARHYSQYYRKGGFATKLGYAREDFKLFPFRVLMVFQSAVRRNNVAANLLSARQPIKSQVWLTTLAELNGDPFSSIWIRPMGFKPANKDMGIDIDRAKDVAGGIRHPHFEAAIDDRMEKNKLLALET